MGRGPGSAKRSGRDEPPWVAIHKCTGAMPGISLNSYLYLKLEKMLCLSYYLLRFLFNKIRRGRNRFCPEAGRGDAGMGAEEADVAQTMYIHVSKCKNDKIKERKDSYSWPTV
jgi:hypothetical protein